MNRPRPCSGARPGLPRPSASRRLRPKLDRLAKSTGPAGEYEIRLRPWPDEADAAINAPLPAAANVPDEPTGHASPGKAVSVVAASIRIGDVIAESPVMPGAKEVVFRIALPIG